MSEAGARVADVACGVGWAAISLARAYPNITVDGFDLDESSIEIASRYADEAGVADRVHFEAKDAADPALESRYDLAMVVEAIHDLSQPVAALRSIREMLKPGGTLIVADERTEDSFTAPASETSGCSTRTASCVACRLPWTTTRRRRPARSCEGRPSRPTRGRPGSTASRSCPSSTTSFASIDSIGDRLTPTSRRPASLSDHGCVRLSHHSG